jgi:glucose uptake protein
MYLPPDYGTALLLACLSTVAWGSWANSYKGTRAYPFPLFYWDYILGVLICAVLFALTLGSTGTSGEPFLANIQSADLFNIGKALLAGIIFNIANLLLVAALDIAGLAVAFPIAIGIAVVEGVVLSYLLQPKGNPWLLGLGVLLALAAVLANARAYAKLTGGGSASGRTGIMVSVVSGLLMGAFAPFVASAMTSGHALTPYSVAVCFAVGAVLCNVVAGTWLMRRPLVGDPVSFSGFWQAGAYNHLLGLVGGLIWGVGGCFNFISAGYLGVPISYAIGQSAPLIAALWGVIVWREFKGAPSASWAALALMFVLYVSAILSVALAYGS